MVIKYKLMWGGIFYKKLRLFLSVIGIIIGVASLLIMNSFGESAKIKTLKEIETFGPEVMMVVAGSVRVHGGRAIQTEITTTLKPDDAEALRKLKGIKYLSPVFNGEGIVRYLGNNLTTVINGVNEEYLWLRKFTLLQGRNFLKDEIFEYKKVAILGYKVKKELFGDKNPLGKTILINKLPFRVIGVLTPIGIDASNADQDDQILIPWSVAISAVYNVDYIRSIYLSVKNLEEISLIEKQINEILLNRHKVSEKNKDFDIVKAEDILEVKTQTTKVFSTLVKSISILTLLVGALGVTAIMNLSINERKKEIGIRKALGAKDKDILYQFLLESVFITLLGGFIGILIGTLGSLFFLPFFKYPLVFPWIPILTSTLLTILSGIIAGIYPAFKATKIEPIILLKQGI